ncbi:hypothetical protein [Streptomyces muensis]|uniref:Uncharacterized protein n=1 Tax=Streptomyces muensis TaxID=1077944 RepID=A0A9X1Q564_STRM4|nr:hypothetical protein [Streptomyces muensis]MCF1597948.1 hypothetical protein [Streptomyces muensis]
MPDCSVSASIVFTIRLQVGGHLVQPVLADGGVVKQTRRILAPLPPVADGAGGRPITGP